MKAGDLDVTVFQNAAGQGKGAVDAALKLAKGEKVDQQGLDPLRARDAGQHGQLRPRTELTLRDLRRGSTDARAAVPRPGERVRGRTRPA